MKTILKIKAGSHLYGTNTETSDEDYIGIHLNSKEEILGLNNCEIIDLSTISKNENGRNNSDAIDYKTHELRRFCNLALNCNPTMLEVLFVDKSNIIEITKEGEELLALKEYFLSSKLYDSFMGYAVSQKKKCFVKKENLEALNATYDYIVVLIKDGVNPTSHIYSPIFGVLPELKGCKHFQAKEDNGKIFFQCGDIRFNNIQLKDVMKIIKERLDKASHRSDGILKNGLDYKFVSHNIRLLLEGIELYTTKNLVLPLKYAELVKAIKMGKMPNEKVFELMEKYENEFHNLKDKNILPNKGNFNIINNFVINSYFNYLKE